MTVGGSDTLYETVSLLSLSRRGNGDVILSKSSKTAKKGTKAKAKPKPKPSKTTKSKAKEKPATKKKAPAKKATPKKKTTKKATTKSKPKRTTSKYDATILKELETEIGNDDEQIAMGAIGRLGQMKDPKATQVLVLGLKHPRHMVRIHVAAQLGERKDKKAVDALIESLQDESIFVRQTVAGALENIGGTKAKKAISKAEKDGVLLDDLPEGRRLDN